MDDNITVNSDDYKKVIRRLDALQKTVDLLYSDRTIMEDILGRLSTVEDALTLNKQHQVLVQKDLKADLRDVKHAVEDKVDEVRMQVQDNTIIIGKDSTLKKIRKLIGI